MKIDETMKQRRREREADEDVAWGEMDRTIRSAQGLPTLKCGICKTADYRIDTRGVRTCMTCNDTHEVSNLKHQLSEMSAKIERMYEEMNRLAEAANES